MLHKVYRTSAQGIPLGAGVNFEKFKLIMLDIGLTQNLLGVSEKEWILNPLVAFVNKCVLGEALVGQEILAYAPANRESALYYWHREQRGSQAEVDYVINEYEKIIPIEVKSGSTGRLKSLHYFLENIP